MRMKTAKAGLYLFGLISFSQPLWAEEPPMICRQYRNSAGFVEVYNDPHRKLSECAGPFAATKDFEICREEIQCATMGPKDQEKIAAQFSKDQNLGAISYWRIPASKRLEIAKKLNLNLYFRDATVLCPSLPKQKVGRVLCPHPDECNHDSYKTALANMDVKSEYSDSSSPLESETPEMGAGSAASPRKNPLRMELK
jgi:hypothetical protein